MRILVVGGAGLVGRQLMLQGARAGHEMHGTYKDVRVEVPSAHWHSLDATDFFAVSALLDELIPEAVIYTAAFHVVDHCETNHEAAKLINTDAPLHFADWCSKHKAHFTFISTDYVFDGQKSGLYLEEDAVAPKSNYARTKHETEAALMARHPTALSCRTSVIYGYHPGKLNFVLWLLEQLRAKKQVKIVDDQYSCPTLANDLAAAILSLVKIRAHGIYHTVGSECINRYEFSLLAADIFKLDRSFILLSKTPDLKQLAARPPNGCMSINKLVSATGVRMSNAREGLLKTKEEMETASEGSHA